MTQWGRTQLAVARTLSDPALGNSFVAVTRTQRLSCQRAADRGLLRRDPVEWHRYWMTEKGWRELLAWEEELERRAHLRDMERLGA